MNFEKYANGQFCNELLRRVSHTVVGLDAGAIFMTSKDSNFFFKVVYMYITELFLGKKMCISFSWSFQTNRKSK